MEFISNAIAAAEGLSGVDLGRTTFEQAVLSADEIAPEHRHDWEEVQNYILAMQYAIERLQELPISNRLLRETHGHLLKGVRGTNKTPGEFRLSQNWIGGASISDAVFVPPINSEVSNLMSDLEKFAHNTEDQIPETPAVKSYGGVVDVMPV